MKVLIANQDGIRDLDTTAVTRSRMYVDRLEATLGEAGDFLIQRAKAELTTITSSERSS